MKNETLESALKLQGEIEWLQDKIFILDKETENCSVGFSGSSSFKIPKELYLEIRGKCLDFLKSELKKVQEKFDNL